MHFAPTLTVLTTILSAASTAHTGLAPRQAETAQCANTTSITNSTTPTPLSALLSSFLPFSPTAPLPQDPHIQIRETSMLYPLLIDGKAFPLLDLLFSPDIIANLSQGPIITGLPALQAALQASVVRVTSHHNLGTQVIDYRAAAPRNPSRISTPVCSARATRPGRSCMRSASTRTDGSRARKGGGSRAGIWSTWYVFPLFFPFFLGALCIKREEV